MLYFFKEGVDLGLTGGVEEFRGMPGRRTL